MSTIRVEGVGLDGQPQTEELPIPAPGETAVGKKPFAQIGLPEHLPYTGVGIEARVRLEDHLRLVRKVLDSGGHHDGDYGTLVQTEVILVDTLRRWERDARTEELLRNATEPVRLPGQVLAGAETPATLLTIAVELLIAAWDDAETRKDLIQLNMLNELDELTAQPDWKQRLRAQAQAAGALIEERWNPGIDAAIEALNSMLAADPDAMLALISHRVSCNDALADHPSCQVGGEPGAWVVGLLGVLNGIFGTDEQGWGYISATLDDERLLSFQRTPAQLHAFRQEFSVRVIVEGVVWRCCLRPDLKQRPPEGVQWEWYNVTVETDVHALSGSARWSWDGLRLHVVDLPSEPRTHIEAALQKKLEGFYEVRP